MDEVNDRAKHEPDLGETTEVIRSRDDDETTVVVSRSATPDPGEAAPRASSAEAPAPGGPPSADDEETTMVAPRNPVTPRDLGARAADPSRPAAAPLPAGQQASAVSNKPQPSPPVAHDRSSAPQPAAAPVPPAPYGNYGPGGYGPAPSGAAPAPGGPFAPAPPWSIPPTSKRRSVSGWLIPVAVIGIAVTAVLITLAILRPGPLKAVVGDRLDISNAQSQIQAVLTDPATGYGLHNVTGVTCNHGANPIISQGDTFVCQFSIDGHQSQATITFLDDSGTFAVGRPQ